jgi:hypothetical protein
MQFFPNFLIAFMLSYSVFGFSMEDAPQPAKADQITLKKILNNLEIHRQNVIALERQIVDRKVAEQAQYVEHLKLMVGWTHKKATDMLLHEASVESGKHLNTRAEVLSAAEERKRKFLAEFPEQDALINKVYQGVKKSVALSPRNGA